MRHELKQNEKPSRTLPFETGAPNPFELTDGLTDLTDNWHCWLGTVRYSTTASLACCTPERIWQPLQESFYIHHPPLTNLHDFSSLQCFNQTLVARVALDFIPYSTAVAKFRPDCHHTRKLPSTPGPGTWYIVCVTTNKPRIYDSLG